MNQTWMLPSKDCRLKKISMCLSNYNSKKEGKGGIRHGQTVMEIQGGTY